MRKLVKSSKHDLIITTGTATLRHGGASTDITLHDGRGGKQAVAPYLWKVRHFFVTTCIVYPHVKTF